MQNNIQIFEHRDFGKVRTVLIDEQPWWVLADVCKILGLSNPTMVAGKLDADEKLKIDPKSNLGSRTNMRVTVISESGLYAVILRSDKPNAKAFRKWVTSEILPSIRRNGAYVTDDMLDSLIENPESAVKLLAKLKGEREQKAALEKKQEILKEYVAELKPKGHYYDIILQCPGAVLTSVIAKDYGYSCVKFNRLLHALGIQFRYKTNKTWLLYHEHDNNGYTITNTYHHNGNAYILMCWTQKGRRFLYNFLAGYGILPQVEINNEPDAVS